VRCAKTTIFLAIVLADATATLAQDHPSVVYAGSERGLLASHDGGATWLQDAALGGRNVHAVGVHPVSRDLLFVAADRQILRTVNGGVTWESCDAPDASGVRAILTDPTVPTHVYAVGDGILESSDGGAHWWRVSVLPADAGDLAFDPVNPKTIYVASRAGVFKSEDAGIGWKRLPDSPPAQRIAIALDNSGVIYASSSGTSVMSDGEHWRSLGSLDPGALVAAAGYGTSGDVDLTLLETMGTRALAVDPRSDSAYVMFAVCWTGEWSDIPCSTALLTANHEAWTGSLFRQDTEVFAVDPAVPEIMCQAGVQGLYRSSDGGRTWVAAKQFERTYIRAVVVGAAQGRAPGAARTVHHRFLRLDQ
jgi:photosystem II stability/assembly factor-like uncharacterized protein